MSYFYNISDLHCESMWENTHATPNLFLTTVLAISQRNGDPGPKALVKTSSWVILLPSPLLYPISNV